MKRITSIIKAICVVWRFPMGVGDVALDFKEQGFTDFEKVDIPSNVTCLNLSGNRISYLEPLSGLSSLTHLFLDSNQISDLSPLARLPTLRNLKLGGNNISDWSPISHVPQVFGRP